MKVYNTLSGQKEEFLPQGDEVKMYVCGVTPYDDSHIGHAMSYIAFDVIRRYLQFRGYRLKYVQNITDIDDKIIDRASKLGIPARELAEKYANSFFADMEALNIGQADIYPRATEEIPKIIEVIQGLVEKGHAYPARGSVYFRVRSFADYGKLSRRNLESMMAGMRIEVGEDKENPMDFTLWKAAKPGEPSWSSPWGNGRPGWHIECSAMSLKYLGDTIDIHGGGQDLIFPHHENEIAQSESFTGKKPFVRYWLHNGLLQLGEEKMSKSLGLGEEKMSKSLGNLITIKEALAKYSADAIRIFVLSSHYRSPLTYSEEALEAAENGVERLMRVISRDDATGGKGEALDAEPYRKQFIEAMDDDFNTARALGRIFELAAVINRAIDSGRNIKEARQLLKQLACDILGLTLKPPEKPAIEKDYFIELQESIIAQIREEKLDKVSDEIAPLAIQKDELEKDAGNYIDSLVSIRNVLRDYRHYKLGDRIRERLDELGIALEDTPTGTVWKRKR
jgi:cysteinyl-tRNA synthetase